MIIFILINFLWEFGSLLLADGQLSCHFLPSWRIWLQQELQTYCLSPPPPEMLITRNATSWDDVACILHVLITKERQGLGFSITFFSEFLGADGEKRTVKVVHGGRGSVVECPSSGISLMSSLNQTGPWVGGRKPQNKVSYASCHIKWINCQHTLSLLNQHTLICCSVARSCPTLCDPMHYSMPCFPVLHRLLEFAQIHVHWVDDVI